MELSSGIELKLKFVVGRKSFYTLETQLEQQVQRDGTILNETDTNFQAFLYQRVLAVEDDGSGHIITTTTPPQENPGNERQTVYQLLNTRGAVLDVSGMNPTNSFALPEERVTIDTSWSGEIILPLPQAPQPIRCITEYIVTGMTEFNGLECLAIDCIVDEFEFEMPLPGGQGIAKVLMGSQGSMLFAPKEGILARMEVETVTSPHVGQVVFTTSTLITQEFQRFL